MISKHQICTPMSMDCITQCTTYYVICTISTANCVPIAILAMDCFNTLGHPPKVFSIWTCTRTQFGTVKKNQSRVTNKNIGAIITINSVITMPTYYHVISITHHDHICHPYRWECGRYALKEKIASENN